MKPGAPLSKGKIFDVLHKALPEGGLALEQDDPENPMPGGLPQPDAPPAAPVPDAPPEPVAPVPDSPPLEPVSAQPADPWADAEEIEYDDADFDKKYKVKAPKSEAEAIRKGFMRQSDYSKKTASLGKWKGLINTLIESGGIETAAAVWERGQQDEAYRNFMLEGLYRTSTGKPLRFADDQPQPPAQQYAPPENADDDPLGLRAVLESSPLARDLAELKGERQKQQQWEQQRFAVQQASNRAQAQTYADFGARFPGEFTGDAVRDEPAMMRVYKYAENAGILNRTGAMQNPAMLPTAMLMAKYEMDLSNQKVPPSAALSAAQAAEQADRISREKLAASIGAGGGNPPPPKPAPKPKVPNTDARGKLRPVAAVFKDLVAARGLES